MIKDDFCKCKKNSLVHKNTSGTEVFYEGAKFEDSDGNAHDHDLNEIEEEWECSNCKMGYSFTIPNTCWCGWTQDIEDAALQEEVKREIMKRAVSALKGRTRAIKKATKEPKIKSSIKKNRRRKGRDLCKTKILK